MLFAYLYTSVERINLPKNPEDMLNNPLSCSSIQI